MFKITDTEPDIYDPAVVGDDKLQDSFKQLSFTCSICQGLLREPVQGNNCQHIFCKKCLDQWISTKRPGASSADCPNCRSIVSKGARENTLVSFQMRSFSVLCPNHARGCKKTPAHGDVLAHWRMCPATKCSCNDCKVELVIGEVEEHRKTTCPARKVPCPRCNAPCKFAEVDRHMQSDCPHNLVSCPNACFADGALRQVAQKDIRAHLDKDCPLEPVACSFVGCRHSCVRSDISAHENDEKQIMQHLRSMNAYLKSGGSVSGSGLDTKSSFRQKQVRRNESGEERPHRGRYLLTEYVWENRASVQVGDVLQVRTPPPLPLRAPENEDEDEDDDTCADSADLSRADLVEVTQVSPQMITFTTLTLQTPRSIKIAQKELPERALPLGVLPFIVDDPALVVDLAPYLAHVHGKEYILSPESVGGWTCCGDLTRADACRNDS